MAHVPDVIGTDSEHYLNNEAENDLLRVITCGSAGDGKSTLIDRLLYESKMLSEGQLETVASDSRSFGTQGGEIGFSSLIDDLPAEHERGSTVDIAYRNFSTGGRKFIVADIPSHEEYTRNIVNGAANADVAILMVDVCKGIQTQARRHTYLVNLLGSRHILVAINKMDLVGYSAELFEKIAQEYRDFAARLGVARVTVIPVSALRGDNIIDRSGSMPWYQGTTIMRYLETVELDEARTQKAPFRFAVECINRPSSDFGGFAGTVLGGMVKPGDRVRIQPSGKEARIASIVTQDRQLDKAVAGQSVTLLLEQEVDIAPGDLISGADSPASVANQFETTVIWMHEHPLVPGRNYLMKIGAKMVTGTVTDIKYQINVNTLEHAAAKQLEFNAIAECNISTDRPIAFDAYSENRSTGGYILIDAQTNEIVGTGLINFALRRSQNIHMQHVDINKRARNELKAQKSCVLWFTGLSGAGKSTIANLVEKKLYAMGCHTYLLDGDNVRHGLNKDLGFTEADRVENIRRIAEVAKLMVDAGLIVITAFISPFRAERQMARNLLEDGEFIEVFIDTPLEVAEQRDVKGLYKKARRGELKNFTGIDSPYEPPENPECRVLTTESSPEALAEEIVQYVRDSGIVK